MKTNERTICVTQYDLQRLTDLLETAKASNFRDRSDLAELETELQNARVVEPSEVGPTVVTMNSQVILHDMDTNQELDYRLVFPDDADIEEGLISVLSPVGTAILGYSEGDIIEWRVPAGIRRIKIKKILYQPEAAGDYAL